MKVRNATAKAIVKTLLEKLKWDATVELWVFPEGEIFCLPKDIYELGQQFSNNKKQEV